MASFLILKALTRVIHFNTIGIVVDAIGIFHAHLFDPLGRQPPRQPAIGLSRIDRGVFMREAHRIAREARDLFESCRAALAYGMQAAWAQVKVARDTQAVIAFGTQKLVMQRRGKCGVTHQAQVRRDLSACLPREGPCFATWSGLAQRAVRSPAIVIGDVRG